MGSFERIPLCVALKKKKFWPLEVGAKKKINTALYCIIICPFCTVYLCGSLGILVMTAVRLISGSHKNVALAA